MVDAHQDVFARRICGEGMPDFYATDEMLDHQCTGIFLPLFYYLFGLCKPMALYGHRLDENGNPLIEDCVKNSFVVYYSSPEANSAYDNLYTNKFGLTDKFIAYWDAVAKFYQGNDYIIGYDPINEPFPGDAYNDLTLIEPGVFDAEKL
jgi:endoglycosylceramidase